MSCILNSQELSSPYHDEEVLCVFHSCKYIRLLNDDV